MREGTPPEVAFREESKKFCEKGAQDGRTEGYFIKGNSNIVGEGRVDTRRAGLVGGKVERCFQLAMERDGQRVFNQVTTIETRPIRTIKKKGSSKPRGFFKLE